MSVVVVTGSNRGIGYELCKQFNERGDSVIALCRKTSPQLNLLGVRVIEGIDVSDQNALARLSDTLPKVDVLVNNAGILHRDNLQSASKSSLFSQFEVNAIGPLSITQALLSKLSGGSKVVIVTSRMGSVQDNSSGGMYGYRMSKAAVNMFGKSLAIDLKPQGIAVALLHPGYVRTDMTGGQGFISAVDSAAGLIERIDQLSLENTGAFWHSNGQNLPW